MMVPRAAAGAAMAVLSRRDLVAALAEVVGATHEARFIVEEAARGGTTSRQPDRGEGPLPPEAVASARAMAARRAAGEPLQYVFGHWSFRSLDLLVDRRVLIPRPETEQVVEVALREARHLHGAAPTTVPGAAGGLIAVDVGTGTGAIALVLGDGARRPSARRRVGRRLQRGRARRRRVEPRPRARTRRPRPSRPSPWSGVTG